MAHYTFLLTWNYIIKELKVDYKKLLHYPPTTNLFKCTCQIKMSPYAQSVFEWDVKQTTNQSNKLQNQSLIMYNIYTLWWLIRHKMYWYIDILTGLTQWLDKMLTSSHSCRPFLQNFSQDCSSCFKYLSQAGPRANWWNTLWACANWNQQPKSY